MSSPEQLSYWLGLPACASMDWLLTLVLEWCEIGPSVAKQHWISTIELLGHDHPALPVRRPISCLVIFESETAGVKNIFMVHKECDSQPDKTIALIKLIVFSCQDPSSAPRLRSQQHWPTSLWCWKWLWATTSLANNMRSRGSSCGQCSRGLHESVAVIRLDIIWESSGRFSELERHISTFLIQYMHTYQHLIQMKLLLRFNPLPLSDFLRTCHGPPNRWHPILFRMSSPIKYGMSSPPAYLLEMGQRPVASLCFAPKWPTFSCGSNIQGS